MTGSSNAGCSNRRRVRRRALPCPTSVSSSATTNSFEESRTPNYSSINSISDDSNKRGNKPSLLTSNSLINQEIIDLSSDIEDGFASDNKDSECLSQRDCELLQHLSDSKKVKSITAGEVISVSKTSSNSTTESKSHLIPKIVAHKFVRNAVAAGKAPTKKRIRQVAAMSTTQISRSMAFGKQNNKQAAVKPGISKRTTPAYTIPTQYMVGGNGYSTKCPGRNNQDQFPNTRKSEDSADANAKGSSIGGCSNQRRVRRRVLPCPTSVSSSATTNSFEESRTDNYSSINSNSDDSNKRGNKPSLLTSNSLINQEIIDLPSDIEDDSASANKDSECLSQKDCELLQHFSDSKKVKSITAGEVISVSKTSSNSTTESKSHLIPKIVAHKFARNAVAAGKAPTKKRIRQVAAMSTTQISRSMAFGKQNKKQAAVKHGISKRTTPAYTIPTQYMVGGDGYSTKCPERNNQDQFPNTRKSEDSADANAKGSTIAVCSNQRRVRRRVLPCPTSVSSSATTNSFEESRTPNYSSINSNSDDSNKRGNKPSLLTSNSLINQEIIDLSSDIEDGFASDNKDSECLSQRDCELLQHLSDCKKVKSITAGEVISVSKTSSNSTTESKSHLIPKIVAHKFVRNAVAAGKAPTKKRIRQVAAMSTTQISRSMAFGKQNNKQAAVKPGISKRTTPAYTIPTQYMVGGDGYSTKCPGRNNQDQFPNTRKSEDSADANAKGSTIAGCSNQRRVRRRVLPCPTSVSSSATTNSFEESRTPNYSSINSNSDDSNKRGNKPSLLTSNSLINQEIIDLSSDIEDGFASDNKDSECLSQRDCELLQHLSDSKKVKSITAGEVISVSKTSSNSTTESKSHLIPKIVAHKFVRNAVAAGKAPTKKRIRQVAAMSTTQISRSMAFGKQNNKQAAVKPGISKRTTPAYTIPTQYMVGGNGYSTKCPGRNNQDQFPNTRKSEDSADANAKGSSIAGCSNQRRVRRRVLPCPTSVSSSATTNSFEESRTDNYSSINSNSDDSNKRGNKPSLLTSNSLMNQEIIDLPSDIEDDSASANKDSECLSQKDCELLQHFSDSKKVKSITAGEVISVSKTSSNSTTESKSHLIPKIVAHKFARNAVAAGKAPTKKRIRQVAAMSTTQISRSMAFGKQNKKQAAVKHGISKRTTPAYTIPTQYMVGGDGYSTKCPGRNNQDQFPNTRKSEDSADANAKGSTIAGCSNQRRVRRRVLPCPTSVSSSATTNSFEESRTPNYSSINSNSDDSNKRGNKPSLLTSNSLINQEIIDLSSDIEDGFASDNKDSECLSQRDCELLQHLSDSKKVKSITAGEVISVSKTSSNSTTESKSHLIPKIVAHKFVRNAVAAGKAPTKKRIRQVAAMSTTQISRSMAFGKQNNKQAAVKPGISKRTTPAYTIPTQYMVGGNGYSTKCPGRNNQDQFPNGPRQTVVAPNSPRVKTIRV